MVIGNELHRRKLEVVFVSRKPSTSTPAPTSSESTNESTTEEPNAPKKRRVEGGNGGGAEDTWLRLDEAAVEAGKEIEEDIVAELVRRHTRWIEKDSQ